MVFAFDREDLSIEAKEDFEREAGRGLMILPRRNFESFLIHPAAIADVINNYVPDMISEETAASWIIENGGAPEYSASAQWGGDWSQENWLKYVDGARFIADAFKALSENKLEYRKTKHSSEIMIAIQHRADGHLALLESFVGELVKRAFS